MKKRKKEAIEELQNYKGYKINRLNLREKIKALDETSAGISYDDIRVDSGIKNSIENTMITRINEKEELERALKIIEANISIIERALENLSDEEKQILTVFYIDRLHNPAFKMETMLNTTRSNVYNIKDVALKKFIIMVSGSI